MSIRIFERQCVRTITHSHLFTRFPIMKVRITYNVIPNTYNILRIRNTCYEYGVTGKPISLCLVTLCGAHMMAPSRREARRKDLRFNFKNKQIQGVRPK